MVHHPRRSGHNGNAAIAKHTQLGTLRRSKEELPHLWNQEELQGRRNTCSSIQLSAAPQQRPSQTRRGRCAAAAGCEERPSCPAIRDSGCRAWWQKEHFRGNQESGNSVGCSSRRCVVAKRPDGADHKNRGEETSDTTLQADWCSTRRYSKSGCALQRSPRPGCEIHGVGKPGARCCRSRASRGARNSRSWNPKWQPRNRLNKQSTVSRIWPARSPKLFPTCERQLAYPSRW